MMSFQSGVRSQRHLLSFDGSTLEIEIHESWGADVSIVLLHEALGSVSSWQRFPNILASATGTNVFVYSRKGHGRSEGPCTKRSPDSYRREAEIVIPALLRHFRVQQPILYGHSEGAAIAILYAAKSNDVRGLILECPHIIAQEFGGSEMELISSNYCGSAMQRLLSRYHRDADGVFSSWVMWASSTRKGDSALGGDCGGLACPVLVIQGARDHLGNDSHLHSIKALTTRLRCELLQSAGHFPHREQTEEVLKLISRFLKRNCKSQHLTKRPKLLPASIAIAKTSSHFGEI